MEADAIASGIDEILRRLTTLETQVGANLTFQRSATIPSVPSAACTIKLLPEIAWQAAAARSIEINPQNAPAANMLREASADDVVTPMHLALLTQKYWGNGGVHLTVGFLDNPPADLRARILSHMNAWDTLANARFVETNTDPQVRISRTPGDGYWSNLGTDILSIPAGQPTMNL